MLFVAVAAINFAAVRAALGSRGPTHGLLAIGALPVASVLAMGLLAGRRRPDRHPFLLGFTTFGAAALALYLFLAIFLAEQTLAPYVSLFLEPLVRIFGPEPSVAFISAVWSVAAVMLVSPQLAFAILGGFLSRKYKVSITRR
jgi:hypothetical protein